MADAAQFLEARGYSFAPDDAGIGAALRYQLNSGACVGTSALFGALLNGDYDEVGYVYVFWLESEHVFNYVKQDGVYYACDFIYGPVTQSGTDARRSSIRYSGESLSGLFDAYAQQEGSDIGNAVAIMYTTAYCGDPTMPTVWLRDSADGHQSTIYLSNAEKDTQQILLLRDGYTFTFLKNTPAGGNPGGRSLLLIARSTVPGRCGRRTAPPPSYCGRCPGQALCRSASPGR